MWCWTVGQPERDGDSDIALWTWPARCKAAKFQMSITRKLQQQLMSCSRENYLNKKSLTCGTLCTQNHCVSVVQNSSYRDPEIDPNKTMKTPTTSIQFLCPGRTAERTVYCGMRNKTTDELRIMLTTVPEAYCMAYTAQNQVETDAMQWTETAAISNKVTGHTGSSSTKVKLVLQTKQVRKAQNNDLNLFSLKQGYILMTSVSIVYINPPNPATATPIVVTYPCGMLNNSKLASLRPVCCVACLLLFSDWSQQVLKWLHSSGFAFIVKILLQNSWFSWISTVLFWFVSNCFVQRLNSSIFACMILSSQRTSAVDVQFSFVSKSLMTSELFTAWSYLCLCHGWITNTTPATHNKTNKTFAGPIFSVPHNPNTISPHNKMTVVIEHWAAEAGAKAKLVYIAVDSTEIIKAYRTVAGKSLLGTLGDWRWYTIHRIENRTIATLLKTCNSKSGTLLSSNWTLVAPMMWEIVLKIPAKIPFKLSDQDLVAVSLLSSSPGSDLFMSRSFRDSSEPSILQKQTVVAPGTCRKPLTTSQCQVEPFCTHVSFSPAWCWDRVRDIPAGLEVDRTSGEGV